MINMIDFGPPEKLRICIYKDVNISEEQADAVVAALQQEFSHFGLIIEVPWIKQLESYRKIKLLTCEDVSHE